MTIPQTACEFARLALFGALITTLGACSDSKESPGAATTAGSGGAAGSAGSAGSAATAGGSSGVAGGSASSDEIVGTFQVEVLVDAADPTTGRTNVVGQVGDGPVPSTVAWTVVKTEGGCRLETPSAPFCEAGCGADVCVADDVCKPYPTGHSVGEVTLSGAQLNGGGSVIMLKEIAKAYQLPAGTSLVYPPFAATDDVTVKATGGDYAAFELATKGVDPLLITSTDFALDVDKPLELTWDAPADPAGSQIYLKLDLTHHGGARGKLECDVDDTGSLTISGAMIGELIGLGVAGYPKLTMIRQSLATARIAPGRVKLEVSSSTTRDLTVKGVDSCTTTEDCPAGKTCRTMDSTCQ